MEHVEVSESDEPIFSLKKGWFSDTVAEGSLRAARTLTHLTVVLVLRLLYKQIINHIYNNKLK